MIFFFQGHKKLIGELLGVTSSRISEWKRIWNHANQMKNKYPDIKALMDHPKTPLKLLLDCLELKRIQEKDSRDMPASSSSSNNTNTNMNNCDSISISQPPHELPPQVYLV